MESENSNNISGIRSCTENNTVKTEVPSIVEQHTELSSLERRFMK